MEESSRAFFKGLKPKGDNFELWVKFGHDTFYRAQWDCEGNLSGVETKLATKGDPTSRVATGKPIPNLLGHLSARALREPGGVFYLPTQPLGLPLAECVTETDDLGVEIDSLPLDRQRALVEEFTEVTGLNPASVLTSGGVSVHAHFKTEQHVPVEDLAFYRALAVISFQSDPVTVRLHQPMRLPGFFRQEKGAYQELLSLSESRYSLAELNAGFRKWFARRGWEFPEEISEQWWREVWNPLLRSSNKASPELKLRQTADFLREGEAAYLARRRSETAERQAARSEVRPTPGDRLSDLLEAIARQASATDFEGVAWRGQNGHYRGQCPFHQGKSGTSAWLSDAGEYLRFHCTVCTNDEPRSLFEYWCARTGETSIEGGTRLRGKAFVSAAQKFLGAWGIDLPAKKKPQKKESEALLGDGSKGVLPSGARAEAQTVVLSPTESNTERAVVSVSALAEAIAAQQTAEQNFTALAEEYAQLRKQQLEGVAVDPIEIAQVKIDLDLAKSARASARALAQSERSRIHQARGVERLNRLEVSESSEKATGWKKDFTVLSDFFGDRLRFNSLNEAIELEGVPLDLTHPLTTLTYLTGYAGWNKSDSACLSIVAGLAKRRTYCPIQEYLRTVLSAHQSTTCSEDLDALIWDLFKVKPSDELSFQAIRAFALGAVKRAFEPGCAYPTLPIFYSPSQGRGKSELLRTLVGPEFFGEGQIDLGSPDALLAMRRSWVFEIPECEEVFASKSSAKVKGFVTQRADTYREPYAAVSKKHPRRTVLVGTTNSNDFLSDESGNRRFLVIPISEEFSLNTNLLEASRDYFWACACAAYQAGEPCTIPERLWVAAETRAQEYLVADPWQPLLEAYANGAGPRLYLTASEAYDRLEIPQKERTTATDRRIARIFRVLGYWRKTRQREGSAREYRYYREDPDLPGV